MVLSVHSVGLADAAAGTGNLFRKHGCIRDAMLRSATSESYIQFAVYFVRVGVLFTYSSGKCI